MDHDSSSEQTRLSQIHTDTGIRHLIKQAKRMDGDDDGSPSQRTQKARNDLLQRYHTPIVMFLYRNLISEAEVERILESHVNPTGEWWRNCIVTYKEELSRWRDHLLSHLKQLKGITSDPDRLQSATDLYVAACDLPLKIALQMAAEGLIPPIDPEALADVDAIVIPGDMVEEYLRRYREEVTTLAHGHDITDIATLPSTLTFEHAGLQLHEPPHFINARYKVVGQLGAGGFGVVWKARDRQLNRDVAIKGIGPNGRGNPEQLKKEAETQARFNSPLLVHVYDVIQDEDGKVYIVQELAIGRTLKDWINKRRTQQGPWKPTTDAEFTQVIAIIAGIAEGLAILHEGNTIHRDLKPSNVVVIDDVQGGIAGIKLLDFGLAVHASDRHRAPRGGTRYYMAPEQHNDSPEKVTTAADIWSLGVILYELLTGQLPFQAKDSESPAALATRVRNEEPNSPRALNPKVPEQLSAICLKCLSKKAQDRYGSVTDLIAALAEVKKTIQSPIATPAQEATAPASVSRRTQATVAVGVLVLILIGYAPWVQPTQLPKIGLGQTPPINATANDNTVAPPLSVTPDPKLARLRVQFNNDEGIELIDTDSPNYPLADVDPLKAGDNIFAKGDLTGETYWFTLLLYPSENDPRIASIRITAYSGTPSTNVYLATSRDYEHAPGKLPIKPPPGNHLAWIVTSVEPLEPVDVLEARIGAKLKKLPSPETVLLPTRGVGHVEPHYDSPDAYRADIQRRLGPQWKLLETPIPFVVDIQEPTEQEPTKE